MIIPQKNADDPVVEFTWNSEDPAERARFEALAGMVLDLLKMLGRCWYLQILQSIKSI
jgi:hypothetical protein